MNGKSIIRYAEGKEYKAYLCPAGKWTIGYGHTRGVTSGMVATDEQIEKWLDEDYEEAEMGVRSVVKVDLTPNQLGALTSFVFNLGIGNFKASTLLRKLNAGDYTGAAAEFDRWVYASVHGVKTKLEGLVKRRKLERSLFEDIA